MKAITTKEFQGVPDGEIHGKTFKADDPVFGDLAKVAVREKWATEVKDDKAAPEKKTVSFDDMTQDELVSHAAANKIDISKAKNRAEILAAIKAAAK